MVMHLLRDLLRRTWVMYAVMGPLLIVTWVIVATGSTSIEWAMRLSLFNAIAVGPMASVSSIGLREIRLLPIYRHELWRLTWLASTVLPSILIITAAFLSFGLIRVFGGSVAVPGETPWLAALYGFVYSSFVLALLPAFTSVSGHMKSGLAKTVVQVAMAFGLLAAMGAPYLFAPLLPQSLDQFSPASVGILLAAIAASCAVATWVPSSGPTPVQTRLRPSARVRTHVRHRAADRLTGIPRLMVPSMLLTSVLTALAVVGTYWYVGPTSSSDFTAVIGKDVAGMAYMLISMTGPWMPWARLLKNLPLSTHALNALLLFTPTVTWLTVITTMWVMEAGLGSVIPEWVGPTDLIWFGGMTALVSALAFRNQGHVSWLIGPAAATSPMVHGLARSVQAFNEVWLLVAGIGVLMLAAWVNHRTLTRCGSSSRAFRRPALAPFGISGPAAPR